ncbi:MAG: hypothetical protein ACJ8AK_04540 [Gemmatimonadaceae bacterium]
MTDKPELDEAFDAAVAATMNCRAAGMVCVDGSSAIANLDRLEGELVDEKTRALERGSVDKEWFQKTVRWLVEWVPETELALIAALGRIARAKRR